MSILMSEDHQEGCMTPGRPHLIGTNPQTGRAVVLQPDCGLWDCPHCAAKNASRWTARAFRGALEIEAMGHKLNFVTLTHRGHLNARQTMHRWRECWPKLAARVRRATGKNWFYMYVHERHDSGKLHTHFISTDTWTARNWKDYPAQCGFGYMNDKRPVYDVRGAADYVAKYLTKMLGSDLWPKDWRRIGTSRNWPKLPPTPTDENWCWIVTKTALDLTMELDGVRMKGFSIKDGCNSPLLQEVAEFLHLHLQ
jgi:hypothetical protein